MLLYSVREFCKLKLNFSWCIKLPSEAGTLPIKFFQIHEDVVEREPYFRAFEVCKHTYLTNPFSFVLVCKANQLYRGTWRCLWNLDHWHMLICVSLVFPSVGFKIKTHGVILWIISKHIGLTFKRYCVVESQKFGYFQFPQMKNQYLCDVMEFGSACPQISHRTKTSTKTWRKRVSLPLCSELLKVWVVIDKRNCLYQLWDNLWGTEVFKVQCIN